MSNEFDIDIFENLIQKYGCTIRCIKPRDIHIIEKTYANRFPDAEIKFYPPLNREMLFIKGEVKKNRKKYILYFGENELIFNSTKYEFNQLKDIFSFLLILEDDSVMNEYFTNYYTINRERISELYKGAEK